MRQTRAFSLIEVTLALGIIAFALIAILGLVPLGTKSAAEAIDATHTALIGQDVQSRVKSTVTGATFASTVDINVSPWFYDRDGVFIGTAVAANAIYRVDATIHKDWGTNAAPVNVDALVLRPVTVQIRWPVNPSDGNPMGNASASFTFFVRRR